MVFCRRAAKLMQCHMRFVRVEVVLTSPGGACGSLKTSVIVKLFKEKIRQNPCQGYNLGVKKMHVHSQSMLMDKSILFHIIKILEIRFRRHQNDKMN